MAKRSIRDAAWKRLASDTPQAALNSIAQLVNLESAIDAGKKILTGEVRGRIVVDVNV
jgi:acrylyl-CoA reductase (NADPH)